MDGMKQEFEELLCDGCLKHIGWTRPCDEQSIFICDQCMNGRKAAYQQVEAALDAMRYPWEREVARLQQVAGPARSVLF
jgi:hypothetical protein